MPDALPRITMVTCSYQQARFLDATLRSVLAQQYPDLEYLVIDGASTDGSRAIIERHAGALAYWVSEPDSGQADALAKGFRRASGEVLGWLCSDDLLLPGALGCIGTYFRDHPEVDAVYGDALWIDIHGQPLRPKREMAFNRFVFLHDHNYIPQPSMFWRRRLYEAVGGLSTNFELALDTDLWDRFAMRTRIEHLPVYLSCMRYYAEQKTNAAHLKQRGEQEGLSLIYRSNPWARRPMVRNVLWLTARCIRGLHKAALGGYRARVPPEVLPWLETHATPAR